MAVTTFKKQILIIEVKAAPNNPILGIRSKFKDILIIIVAITILLYALCFPVIFIKVVDKPVAELTNCPNANRSKAG